MCNTETPRKIPQLRTEPDKPMNTERYYVVERITLDEPMDLHDAQQRARVLASKHPSAQYHVLKSVGHTTQEVGWEWHNEAANKPILTLPKTNYDVCKEVHNLDNTPQSLAEWNVPERITNDTQYRMLQEGEIIQEGDEFEWDGGYIPASRAAHGTPLFASNVGLFRRPISLDKTEKTH